MRASTVYWCVGPCRTNLSRGVRYELAAAVRRVGPDDVERTECSVLVEAGFYEAGLVGEYDELDAVA
jgi:hypothetical protein